MGYVQRVPAENGRRYLLGFRPYTLRYRFGPWMSKADREAAADAYVRSRSRPARRFSGRTRSLYPWLKP